MVIALDLDGTIVDARRRQVAVAMACLAELDVSTVEPAAFWALKRAGRTTEEALTALAVPAEAARRVAERWVAQIEDPRWLRVDQVVPGARAAITALRLSGSRPFILTARRDQAAASAQIESLDLGFGQDDITIVDPRDAAAAKAEALRRQQAMGFIGDTESDALAADLAGVRFVAVATGQRSAEALRRAGIADVRADLPDAVRDFLT